METAEARQIRLVLLLERRESKDLRGLQKLFDLIEKVIQIWKEERYLVLANTHKLGRCEQEESRRITVLSDLTRMQRNEEVSRVDIDKGEACKTVSKRIQGGGCGSDREVQLRGIWRQRPKGVIGDHSDEGIPGMMSLWVS